MSQQGKEVTFEEYYTANRNQLIISYDNAKELALKNYDDLAKRLVEQMNINQALKTAAIKSSENKNPKVEKSSPKSQKK